jgi:hypothetical protein
LLYGLVEHCGNQLQRSDRHAGVGWRGVYLARRFHRRKCRHGRYIAGRYKYEYGSQHGLQRRHVFVAFDCCNDIGLPSDRDFRLQQAALSVCEVEGGASCKKGFCRHFGHQYGASLSPVTQSTGARIKGTPQLLVPQTT